MFHSADKQFGRLFAISSVSGFAVMLGLVYTDAALLLSCCPACCISLFYVSCRAFSVRINDDE